MPDISHIIQVGAANPWLYLPFAIVLGALHALEPGHAKSLMAAFIVAIRGTASQAVLLGISAAVGHTIIVWGLVIVGLSLGNKLIVEQAEPWLLLASGILIILLALRLLWSVRSHSHHAHDHSHGHDHTHHHHDHPSDEQKRNGQPIKAWEIMWFGFTGGLLPCPSAIAVLLVCLQLKAFALGVAMVAAFSVGLAITLVSVGIAAAWGTRKAADHWPGFDKVASKLPYASAALVIVMGLIMTGLGLRATGLA